MRTRDLAVWGKRAVRWGGLGIVATLAATTLVACDEDEEFVDVTPPAIPNGVYSVTADQLILVRWNPNRERDLAGYHVLSNTDGGNEYFIIATIDAFDPDYYRTGALVNDPGDDYLEFPDFEAVNGTYYWYAIIAFDDHGNESDLSLETVVDVPRPEGAVELFDERLNASLSGYDFSSLSGQPQPSTDPSTDVFYRTDAGGVGYLLVNGSRVRIQDYGNVGFDVASYAPIDGWSATGRTEAIEGHTYVLEIYDGIGRTGDRHYAKLTIVERTSSSVDMDWGYQIVSDERELKQAPQGVRTGPTRVRKEVLS